MARGVFSRGPGLFRPVQSFALDDAVVDRSGVVSGVAAVDRYQGFAGDVAFAARVFHDGDVVKVSDARFSSQQQIDVDVSDGFGDGFD